MSRWGLLADVHCENFRVLGGPVTAGVNLRCRLVGDAFARGLQLAGKVGCDRVAVLGDLFNTGKPSPEVIGIAADTIAGSPVPVYVIPGNHDRSSDEPGNNALAALREVKNCIVVDEPTLIETVLLAPFSPRQPVEYFGELVQRFPAADHVLGHAGIIGVHTPIFLRDSRNAISVEQLEAIEKANPRDPTDWRTGTRGWFMGDWHKHEIHRLVGKFGHAITIAQVGALCQANFGDPPEVGKLCVLDTEITGFGHGKHHKGGITEVHTVTGPRFIIEDFSELKRVEYSGEPDCTYLNTREELDSCDLFLSIRCESDKEQREAEAIISEWEGVAGWKTELVSTAKQQTEVVEAVQGGVQVEDALQEWAAAQPGVSQAVKDRAVQIALECLR